MWRLTVSIAAVVVALSLAVLLASAFFDKLSWLPDAALIALLISGGLLVFSRGFWNGFAHIFFIDIPSLIDSTWRRADYEANKEHVYDTSITPAAAAPPPPPPAPAPAPVSSAEPLNENASFEPSARWYWTTLPFWFFAILVFFVTNGPTGSSLCTAAPEWLTVVARWVLAAAPLVLIGLAWRHWRQPAKLVARQFKRIPPGTFSDTRRRVVVGIAYAVPAIVLLAFVAGTWKFLFTWQDCSGAAFSAKSFQSLALWIGVVACVGVAAIWLNSTRWLVSAHVAAIVLVALVQWYYFADFSVREADHLPYRHVFTFWAAAIVLILVPALFAAPWMFRYPKRVAAPVAASDVDNRAVEAARFRAWLKNTELSPWMFLPKRVAAPVAASDVDNRAVEAARFRAWLKNTELSPWMFLPKRVAALVAASDVDNLAVEAARFRAWLKNTELFESRPEPPLNSRRLSFALIYGPCYHLLHLLLLPSLVGLVVEPQWLYPAVGGAFVFSVFLLMWGHVSARWDELKVQIERWFLRGGPLYVSVLVIVLSVLRVFQFGYISTILDALPFGTIFGMIVMTYVLFWMVEYWLNRIMAVQLLKVVGKGPDEPDEPDELIIRYPRTGPIPDDIHVPAENRFIASHGTGRFAALGRRSDDEEKVAFNSFGFLGLFTRLSEQASTTQERAYAKDIERRIGNYFFSLNFVMLAITAGFIGYYVVTQVYSNNSVDPILETRASSQAGGPADLAGLLVEKPGQSGPAIVVVGSGGGTRAALYTASVLRGLHRLGIDRDIVLLSGVSGGGVALAYFAAYRDALVAPRNGGDECPDGFTPTTGNASLWSCFDESVTKPFIRDVLSGATEWRVFSRAGLSTLLAESFERRLFGDRKLSSIRIPALILNATVVSHPAEASDLLQRTLNEPAAGGAQDPGCDESERTFQMLSGGRLAFTNLRDIGKFPQREARVPDARLPYLVIQADDVPLATAAALNANFPPVFPSARVRLVDAATGECPKRSYYVTDGGALENLGLISALYALASAVDQMPAGSKIRPIHIVLAEASAVTYDYGQDRGLSALGGSRERLAGVLTEALISALEEQVKVKSRDPASPKMELYYLGLPLAFRARGGFGTHWMYAEKYQLSDPRPRSIPWLSHLPWRSEKVSVDRDALKELWLALHDPGKRFCDSQEFERPGSTKVHSWICGVNSKGRDLHMDHWQKLVDRFKPAPSRDRN